MTARVAELWDRPPVRWAFTMLAVAVLAVGAISYWNSRHPAQHASGPSVNAYSSGNPAAFGAPIPFPAKARTLLRQFVKDGILRQNPAATYDMVSPKLHAGMTRSQWATGNIPIPEFPKSAFGGAGLKIMRSRQHELLVKIPIASNSAQTATSLTTLLELKPFGDKWVITYAGVFGGGPPIPAAQ
ncbi:MAG: hypothetical protein ACTHNU_04685 [Gaiellales bacterium]